MEALIMEKVSSATLKKDFGRVMDEVQHTPITVTRHGRDIATIFSHKKIEEAAKQLLGKYPLELVETGGNVMKLMTNILNSLKNVL